MIKKLCLFLFIFFTSFSIVSAEETYSYSLDNAGYISNLTTVMSSRDSSLTLKEDLDERIKYLEEKGLKFYVYYYPYGNKFNFLILEPSFYENSFYLFSNKYNQFNISYRSDKYPKIYRCELDSSASLDACDNPTYVYSNMSILQGQSYFYPYYLNFDVGFSNDITLILKSSVYGDYTFSKGTDSSQFKNILLKNLIEGNTVDDSEETDELKEKYTKKWADNMPDTFFSLVSYLLPVCISVFAIILALKTIFWLLRM